MQQGKCSLWAVQRGDKMQIARPRKSLTTISIVPLVDVMLILLVFFMVTSTYLNLDMVPVAEKSEANLGDTPGNEPTTTNRSMLIRLDASGTPVVRGQAVTLGTIALMIEGRTSEDVSVPVIILPSRNANLQSLVSVMETANEAGAASVRVVRLEAQP